jgi:hypothetical protein
LSPARRAFLVKVAEAIQERNSEDLIGFAVADAMRGLVQNWMWALRESETDPSVAVSDLADLINRLTSIKTDMEAAMPNALERVADSL